jgi:hypothetical protein
MVNIVDCNMDFYIEDITHHLIPSCSVIFFCQSRFIKWNTFWVFHVLDHYFFT